VIGQSSMLHGNNRISSLDLRHTTDEWAFARLEQARIEAHWKQLVATNPALWNGDVLICHDLQVAEGHLEGRFLTTSFASFVAWRDWDWPDRSMRNCFGSAVILSNDGALIYGRMSQATLNPGRVYPPGGSLEPSDIKSNGTVDVRGSIERELEEETGLLAAEAETGEWLAVFDGQRLALAKPYRFELTATAMEERIRNYLAHAEEEELEGVEIIRSSSQIDSRYPGYAAEIARYFLDGEGRD